MAPLTSAKRWRRRTPGLVTALALLHGAPALALTALDEAALSEIDAQDGITLQVNKTSSLNMGTLTWFTDRGAAPVGACTGGVANRHACTILASSLAGASGGPLQLTGTLDAFGGAGGPGLAIGLDWLPMVMRLPTFTLNTPTVDYSTRSLGQFAAYSQGSLRLTNRGGLFASAGNAATVDLTSSGNLIYRQGAAGQPELSFGNFTFNNRFSTGAAAGQGAGSGRIGLDSAGLLISAPYTYTNLQFDVMFKAAPTDFDLTGRAPLVRFGWAGGLVNPVMRLNAGGVGYGTYSSGGVTYFDVSGSNGGGARSQGLNIQASWDFDSDFAWTLGQAGGNITSAHFKNWKKMTGVAASTPMLSMPVTLDVLQNGVGPAGLCFGGGFTSGSPVQASCTNAAVAPSGTAGTWVPSNVPAGKAAFAVLLRDGRLHAYNQQIEIRDPTSAIPVQTYDWSLLYTFGKLDGDVYLYPEGRNQGVAVTTNNTGIKTDITLLAQSPGYWDQANSASATTRNCLYSLGGGPCTGAGAGTRWATNTHFMVADTKVGGVAGRQYGIGLVNADLMWTVRDLYLRVVASDSGYPLLPGGLWLQTDTSAVYRFRGLLGGGDLNNLSAPTSVALVDLNLATNRFIFTLNPLAPDAGGNTPVGFNGLLDLDGTAFFSFGEVSSPASSFRLYDVQGRIGWRNGAVTLVSGQTSVDGLPSVTISNDLLFGASANFGSGGGAPLIAKAGFGNEYFGRIAVPAGTWNSEVSLKIPGN